jgi:hypothetical protein
MLQKYLVCEPSQLTKKGTDVFSLDEDYLSSVI